jgi:hypothetical protein
MPALRRLAPAAAALALLGVAPAGAAPPAQTSLTVDARPGDRPARALGAWTPGRFDRCPAALHDRYATRGSDGKLYPAWHPPVVRDPATGRRCTFGHEHGRDPRGSDLYRWVARHLGGGLPFGAAAEALDTYAAANPGTATRHEDHVGHKVEWQNDVRLLRRTRSGGRHPIGVRCDFLTKLHQGSHSADAFANAAHELIYAVRCDDGTRLLTTTFVRFGRQGAFNRSCAPRAVVRVNGAPRPATSAVPQAAGPAPVRAAARTRLSVRDAARGRRQIPDRACADRHVLVPAGRFSLFARGLYEEWASSNRLTTRSGRQLAYWDPAFAVFDPARYFDRSRPGGLARTVDLCWERTADGRRAAGSACDVATGYGARTAPLPFDDPRSPFTGTRRETHLNQTKLSNRDGPRRWYTDPYGRSASPKPFPGALCQLVSPTDNTAQPTLESQSFGAERPYSARGVHAPN